MADLDIAALAAELKKALKMDKRAPVDDDEDGDPPPRGGRLEPWMQQRLDRESKKRKEAEDRATAAERRIEELSAKVGDLEKGYEMETKKLRETAADSVSQVMARHQEDLALVEHGISDPLGRKALRDAWEALPKDTRPKSAVDYLIGIKTAQAAHVEDPKKNAPPEIPRTVAAYLAPPADTGNKGGGGSGKPPPKVLAKPEGGADPLAAAGKATTMAEYLAALAKIDPAAET
jgi:hypothetical protein